MGITVRKAMGIGGLVQCRVVAGEQGLDREIDHITVMEVPDVIQWLKGHDLLLTSLYPIKDDEDSIRALVGQLQEVGSSALAIKTSRYVDEIPEVILEEGNRLNLPIIEIDAEISYLDIMTPLMEFILGHHAHEDHRLEVFFQWVTELAMGGKGIPAMIEACEQITGNRITLESELPVLERRITVGEPAPLTRLQKNELRMNKRSIRMARLLNGQALECIVAPLMLNDELYGYVTCWPTEHPFEGRELVILDRMIPLLALEFLKVKTRFDVEQAFKDDFLSEVLTGHAQDEDEVITRGHLFGWDFSKDYQVLAISLQADNVDRDAVQAQEFKRKWLQKVHDLLVFSTAKPIIGQRKEHVIVLIQLAELPDFQGALPPSASVREQIITFADYLRKQLCQEFSGASCTIGIGRFYPGLQGIQEGYSEAVRSIQLGRSVWGNNSSIYFGDLGIYRILSRFHDRKELEALFNETVGKLVDYDEKNNAKLAETLFQYFAKDCSLAETADSMFVHVNTLKYRLQKIEQLTGCSVHRAEDRLRLHIGMKLYHLLHTQV
ncbi:PucR family transcriptional regulator [Paenibacillus senegalensis]|uniref:PucR family transcriptional regulator n=1 Tax=Paenibacillus senegalensis TaxID=1465766 RepID=UPI000288BED0|nr:PucR family transcriptional regulator [Paenibacillus senegalensis]